jgi:hypothetical protein
MADHHDPGSRTFRWPNFYLTASPVTLDDLTNKHTSAHINICDIIIHPASSSSNQTQSL